MSATVVRTYRGWVPGWTLNDRLRKSREAAGLEQVQLASRLGVSRGTISNAERGAVKPRRAVVMAWAVATGVDVEWLLDEDPRPGPGVGVLPQLDSNQQPSD